MLGTRHRPIETTDADANGDGNLDCGREVVTNTLGDLCGAGDIGVWEQQSELFLHVRLTRSKLSPLCRRTAPMLAST